MKYLKARITSMIILALLTSCSPKYQTSYDIIPPPTHSGRICANTCLLAKTNCEQTCDLQQMTCRERERLESQDDYQRYVVIQGAAGRPVVRSQRNFTRYYDCSSNACMSNCTNTYHLCHSNCGGQVIPHSTCAMFCPDNAAMPPLAPQDTLPAHR